MSKVARRAICGLIVLKYRDDECEPGFAFIGDCYVHKKILEKNDIQDDCQVKAKMIYAGGGKWEVFEITSLQGTG